jgi:hypothetical protein
MDATYASSSIEFEIDSSSEQLGTKLPKEIVISEDDQYAGSLKFLRWGVNASVIGLHHGKYDGHPASLVIFQIEYAVDGGRRRSRFAESTITVTFGRPGGASQKSASDPQNDNNNNPLRVKLYGPKRLKGPVTQVEHESKTTKAAVLKSPDPVPITLEARVNKTNSRKFFKNHMVDIRGTPWETHGRYNKAKWQLNENEPLEEGIPMDFKFAVVVQHDGESFQATVEITAQAKVRITNQREIGLPLFCGWPWSELAPLLLNTDVLFGPELKSLNFDQLTEDDFERFCEFSDETSVSYILSTSRTLNTY